MGINVVEGEKTDARYVATEEPHAHIDDSMATQLIDLYM